MLTIRSMTRRPSNGRGGAPAFTENMRQVGNDRLITIVSNCGRIGKVFGPTQRCPSSKTAPVHLLVERI